MSFPKKIVQVSDKVPTMDDTIESDNEKVLIKNLLNVSKNKMTERKLHD